jgi:hypothetical protein
VAVVHRAPLPPACSAAIERANFRLLSIPGPFRCAGTTVWFAWMRRVES